MTIETPQDQGADAAPGSTVNGVRDARPDAGLSLGIRLSGGAMVLAAALVFAVIESFLVPLTVSGVYVPVSAVLAVLVNSCLTALAVWLTEWRAAAALPGAVWFAVVVTLASQTGDGDLVITDSWPGMAMLLLGAAAATITGYLAVTRSRRTPAA